MRWNAVVFGLVLASAPMLGQTCTTQAAMTPADRTALADASRAIATAVQANDVTTLRASSTPEIQKDFGALQYMVAVDSPKLAGGAPQVEQIYLLDATGLKSASDSGATAETQFFCSLNKSTAEADFVIPGLPPGRYGFSMVQVAPHNAPWLLAMLLRQDGPRWLLAGFYPKPLTLAGHDGLWYWTQARDYAKARQPWDAWLLYTEAQKLLQPAPFVLSTHLEKLRTEATGATPPALSGGISPETPLTLKAPGAAPAAAAASTQPAKDPNSAVTPDAPSDLHFTALSLGEPLVGSTAPVLEVRLRADALPDPAAARQRNTEAARVLLDTYPELRKPFQTISITTDSPGQPAVTTQMPIADVK